MLSIPHKPVSAVRGRMRIGDALVDVATREIDSPHARRPRRVTPKAMAVLCALVETPGQVVGRDALLARVWPDTLPTDDVLTQAVTQLRKAFGPEGRGYIETIAKSGYRLMAPVERLPDGAATGAPEAGPGPVQVAEDTPAVSAASAGPSPPAVPSAARRPEAAHRRRGPLLVAAAAVLGLLALGVFAWTRGYDDAAPPGPAVASLEPVPTGPERPYRLITSALGYQGSPTLSPDASMVAYSATAEGGGGSIIQVQPTRSAPPRRLTRPPAGASDRLPAWSPDGRDIAFARSWADGRCMVMLVAANGAGPEREVVACDGSQALLSFSWTPDQRGLLFGTMTGGNPEPGIRVFDLASGQWQAIDYEANGGLDHAPRYSPDGRWIAFVRNPQLGDLWRIPAGGGTAEQLTEVGAEIRGWSWLPDGGSLVFSRRIDSGTRLYRLDIDRGEVVDLGLHDAQAPTVSPTTGALAFVRRHPRFGVHRVVRDGPGGDVAGIERLFESMGRDTLPSISPDGRQLVFGSDRSGHFELWWADLSRPESLRPVEGLHPDAQHLPAWSPDGRRVLVSGWREAERPEVFEVDPSSGQWTALPVPAGRPLQAVYTPDPSRLLVTEESGDGIRLVLYDRGAEPWRALGVIDDVSLARVDPDGERVLFTRLSEDGLWQADLALSPESIRGVHAGSPSRWRYRAWAVAGDGGVEYLDRGGDCLVHLRHIGGGGASQGPCLDRESPGSVNGFSVDPRSGDAYVALAVEDGTDIAFMGESEAIERPVGRLAKLLKRMRNLDS